MSGVSLNSESYAPPANFLFFDFLFVIFYSPRTFDECFKTASNDKSKIGNKK